MKNKTIEAITFIYITVFLVVMLNLVIKTVYLSISLEAYSEYIYISGGIGLLLYIISKIKNFHFNKYEIIVFVMIILSCLSLISAIDINTAIFGKTGRFEGLLVWLSYYIFILNAMNIKNKHYLQVIAFIISAHMLSNIYFGLYQLGIFHKPTSFYVNSVTSYATGFLGNSNFLGSLSTIFYGLILGLFIKVEFGWRKFFLLIILLIANLGVLINGAMSAIVAIIAINCVCFIQIIAWLIKKKKNSLIYLGSLIVGIISFVSVFYIYSLNNTKIKNDIGEMLDQTKSVIVDKKAEDNYGTNRFYIWRKTLEKIDEVPLTGCGIDNFQNFFSDPIITEKYVIFVDKAHDDYLQKAICEGIISGIVFVVFLLMIFFKGLISKLSPIYYGLFLAFTSYSVQALFNISFINVAPIYFIIIGLLIGGLKKKECENEEEKSII